MNAGMYPLPGGQPLGARKLAGQIGRNNSIQFLPSSVFSSQGVLAQIVSVSTTRTRVLSVQGRGAARLLGFSPYVGDFSFTTEVVIDGVRALLLSGASSPGNSYGAMVIGLAYTNSYSNILSMDYIPFDSSYEVFVTASLAGQFYLAQLTDIHQ